MFSKAVTETNKAPKKGDLYYIKSYGPWKHEFPVEVLDARDGWVRYKYTGNKEGLYQDERLKEDYFLNIHRHESFYQD